MQRLTILLVFLLLSLNAHAAFMFQHSFLYYSDSDDAQNVESTRMNNYSFISASLDNMNKFYIGQSIHAWSKTGKESNGTEIDMSMLELGPRLLYFFNNERNVHVSFSYNMYAKGTRKVAGVSQDIEGTSMMGSLGYQLKITKTFYMGASINYYSLTLSEKTVDNTTSKVSDKYTAILPMLEFSLRTK